MYIQSVFPKRLTKSLVGSQHDSLWVRPQGPFPRIPLNSWSLGSDPLVPYDIMLPFTTREWCSVGKAPGMPNWTGPCIALGVQQTANPHLHSLLQRTAKGWESFTLNVQVAKSRGHRVINCTWQGLTLISRRPDTSRGVREQLRLRARDVGGTESSRFLFLVTLRDLLACTA